MPKTPDITAALHVSRVLVKACDLTNGNAEESFGEAYRVFFALFDQVASQASSEQMRRDSAIHIADYAVAVLDGGMTMEVALGAVQRAVATQVAILEDGWSSDEESVSAHILNSESEILKSALRIRKLIEQLPLGQEMQTANEYLMTLVVDTAKAYGVERSEGLTELDGYRLFVKAMPVLTDITIECWGRLASAYYNPEGRVLSDSLVDAEMSDFIRYIESYDMGQKENLPRIKADTLRFVSQVAQRESERLDLIGAIDRQGLSIGMVQRLLNLAQRGWRMCINETISEVDEILNDEQAALDWLESGAPSAMGNRSFFSGLERLHAQQEPFSHDADVDLQSIDKLVKYEFSVTVQAADAMIGEMLPWSMER